MTAPKPLSVWQQANTPAILPRHIRRNIVSGDGTCWLWTRSLSRDGYGWASLGDRTYQAHRLVYTLLIGELPEGLILDHLCRMRHCVNPDHLEPVTPRENLRRSPLTPTGMDDCAACGSVFTWNGHQRRCLKCQRVWRRQYARDYRRGLRRREAS